MAAILNSTILESAILSFLSQTHTYLTQDWFPPFAQKKTSLTLPSPLICTKNNFTHSFSVNLIMATILNSAILDSDTDILDSDTLLSSLRFTQKHSLSNLNLTQTNSFWLTWWWQQSWILPSWFWPFCTKKCHSFILTSLDDGSHLEFCQHGFNHYHFGFRHLVILSQIHSYLPTLSLPLWLWLKLIQSDSNSFVLTQLDYGSHLEFYHLELQTLPSWNRPYIGYLPLKLTQNILPAKIWLLLKPFAQKNLQTHSFSLNLMMTAILNSAMLDSASALWNSDTLFSSPRFTQKHSHSNLTLS